MNRHFIPYARQSIDEDDIEQVSSALRGDIITCGNLVEDFEKHFAECVGAPYAVAVSSGTAALHLAYNVVGISEDDELITSPITFAATSNAALYNGAEAVFADIEMSSGNIDIAKIPPLITDKTSVITCVHYGGNPVNMQNVAEITKNSNIVLIEDACHALGAEINGELVGNCKYSHMSIFSFHPVKHITTGEGGAVTTRSRTIYEKLKFLRSHGIHTDPEKHWIKNMTELGYNYRLTDFQCALGISQLKKLSKFLERRRAIAKIYNEAFKECPLITPLAAKTGTLNAYHLYPVLLDKKIDRTKLMGKALEAGIGLQIHYNPVYEHPFYKASGYHVSCPIAEEFSRRIVSLPMYPALSEEEQNYVISSVFKLICL